jgi:hypothetical protein
VTDARAAPQSGRADPYQPPAARVDDAVELPVRGWRRVARWPGWVVAWFVIFAAYWLAATFLVNATTDLMRSPPAPFGISGPAWQGGCLLALLVLPAALGRLAAHVLRIRGPVAFLVPSGVFAWGYFSSTLPFVRSGAFAATYLLVALLVLSAVHPWRPRVPG